MGGWIASGQVKSRDTVVEGLEKMPDAFLGLFTGANTGKMLVRSSALARVIAGGRDCRSVMPALERLHPLRRGSRG